MCLSVYVCLSIREHISGTAEPIFTNFLCRSPAAVARSFLWRRRDTLCTSGFMDDVTFGRYEPYGDALKSALLGYYY